jgi:putative flippase GtrA
VRTDRPLYARADAPIGRYRWARPREWLVEIGRLVRFGIVGTLAATVYAFVTFAIDSTGLTNAVSATIVGHFAAGFVSYFGHLRFSFAVDPDHRIFLWRFFIVAAAMFVMNITITWLFTSLLGISYVIAIATVAVLIPMFNYLCNRHWVFTPGLVPEALAQSPHQATKLGPGPT